MEFQKLFVLLFLQVFLGSQYLVIIAALKSENFLHYLNKRSTVECGVIPDSCPDTCYRSYDGSCNNLAKPSLGTPLSRYSRLLPAKYGDGFSTPTKAESGNELPSARKVSLKVYPDLPIPDFLFTLSTMQYGQFISHDMSLLLGRFGISCCTTDGQVLANSSEFCYPILVSPLDPAYSPYNIQCFSFARTVTDVDRGCIGDLPKAEQLTSVNNFLDLSLVYGNTIDVNNQVRLFTGGKLKSDIKNGQEMLPINPNGVCTVVNADEPCYLAGDVRVNQNPQLVILHTLLLREHNRIADKLAQLNPLWEDECLFQEARKINIAQHQHISYYEWLKLLIGPINAYESKILYDTNGFVNDYDPNVDPSVLNEHATAAFRFFHTQIAGYLSKADGTSLRISDFWNRPVVLEQGDSFDGLTKGLCTQSELAADAYHDKEITLYWLRQPGATIGLDLKAICIQRNRDHGLASYNDYRELCGLPKATIFEDFADVISFSDIFKLKLLYEDPDDVDLTVGGSLERIVPGTLAGPTFLCILTKQFHRTRVGDRFWFENSGKTGFTLPQLNEIRKTSISRLICDNTNTIQFIQPRGFEKISLLNPIVPCNDLPSVDLSLWTDANGCACSSTNSSTSSTSTQSTGETTTLSGSGYGR